MRRTFRHRSSCETGKRRYRDEHEARKALKRAATGHQARGVAKVEQRVYRCHLCQGWHTTSRPDRKTAS